MINENLEPLPGRLVKTIHSEDGIHEVKIYRDVEWNQYVTIPDRFRSITWGFHDDLEDAISSARCELKRTGRKS